MCKPDAVGETIRIARALTMNEGSIGRSRRTMNDRAASEPTSTATTPETEPAVVAAISSADPAAREQAIRERAYAIWEEEGRPEGRDLEHWLQAETEIDSGDAPGVRRQDGS